MKRRLSLQTEAVLAALLTTANSWRYGYELSRAAQLPSGTLYPILSRLADWGWLEHEWQQEKGEKPRHMYRLTKMGLEKARVALKSTKPLRRLLAAEEELG